MSRDVVERFAATLRDGAVHEIPRAAIAVGIREHGADGNALRDALRDAASSRTAPGRAVMTLYRALVERGLTFVEASDWNPFFADTVRDLSDLRDLRDVHALLKRSRWLRSDEVSTPAPSTATEQPWSAVEIATALDRDVPKRERAALIATCIYAAAKLNDDDLGARAIAELPRALAVATIRGAVTALHAASSCTKGIDVARELLTAIDALDMKLAYHCYAPIVAELAAIAHAAGDSERRDKLLVGAREVMFSPGTSHIDRFAGGISVVNVAFRTGSDVLIRECEALVENMKRFTDTFVTSRHYPIHQLLLCEIIVEAFLGRTHALDDVRLR